jgi:hypothetical protein
MAKANYKSSTIDWIWLVDALRLAITRFGSEVLAKALLTKWLEAGRLPWSCVAWDPRDEERLAVMEARAWDLGTADLLNIPPACSEGEPEFWRAGHTISWEDNIASQNSIVGASALGIKVSREHLLELLPEEPRERIGDLGETQPAERKLLEEPKDRSASTAVSKNTSPQSERAKRYIKALFPDGVDDIPTAVIYEKLASDAKLKAELGGRASPSHTVINRVLGRRKV